MQVQVRVQGSRCFDNVSFLFALIFLASFAPNDLHRKDASFPLSEMALRSNTSILETGSPKASHHTTHGYERPAAAMDGNPSYVSESETIGHAHKATRTWQLQL